LLAASQRGCIVNSDEGINTLCNLPNEVVLIRPSNTGRERGLIVPIGSIRLSSTGANHLVVSIGVAGDAASGGYRVYEVGQSLNRLQGRNFP
jgi:hypothetical protein